MSITQLSANNYHTAKLILELREHFFRVTERLVHHDISSYASLQEAFEECLEEFEQKRGYRS